MVSRMDQVSIATRETHQIFILLNIPSRCLLEVWSPVLLSSGKKIVSEGTRASSWTTSKTHKSVQFFSERPKTFTLWPKIQPSKRRFCDVFIRNHKKYVFFLWNARNQLYKWILVSHDFVTGLDTFDDLPSNRSIHQNRYFYGYCRCKKNTLFPLAMKTKK